MRRNRDWEPSGLGTVRDRARPSRALVGTKATQTLHTGKTQGRIPASPRVPGGVHRGFREEYTTSSRRYTTGSRRYTTVVPRSDFFWATPLTHNVAGTGVLVDSLPALRREAFLILSNRLSGGEETDKQGAVDSRCRRRPAGGVEVPTLGRPRRRRATADCSREEGSLRSRRGGCHASGVRSTTVPSTVGYCSTISPSSRSPSASISSSNHHASSTCPFFVV